MGEVYLAYDTVLRRSVAIKVLRDAANDSGNLRRFEREAYAASSLNHPNILTIYEIGTADDHYFIASEYVEGKSLRQWMTEGRLPLTRVLDIAAQVATALSAAHTAGIVHRDIKPENIMVRPDQIAKVLDFGLAKLAEQTHPSAEAEDTVAFSTTGPGFLVGTIPYMSPEQVRGQRVDARSDIWSLGVVLYEMVTGQRPFDGETRSDIIAAILTSEPELLAPDIPAELGDIISKALRRDFDQRYQSAGDLASDLRSLRQRVEFEVEYERKLQSVRGIDSPPARPAGRSSIVPKRRRSSLVVAGVVAALVLFGYLAYSRYSSAKYGETIDSIAVLSFANASGDPELEYLAEGLSESIINKLAQLPDLKVISRSSAARYKATEADPKRIARDLGVEAIVLGRIAKRESDLHISAELVNANDSAHLWGGQYSRRAEGLVALHGEIAEEIALRLRGQLSAGEAQRLEKRETTNSRAYDLLLKGRALWRKGGSENWKKAIDYYQQATVLDPNYAQAYAYLGGSYKSLIGNSILDPGEFRMAAEAATKRALELDPNLADAHYTLANLRTDAWDWAGAEQAFKRAIELNPSSAAAHNAYSNYLAVMGRHDESVASIRRARELDPLSLIIHANVGYRLYFARRYDESIESLKKSLELDKNHALAHILLGYNYAAKRMYPEAIAAYHQAIKSGMDTPGTHISLGAAYAGSGETKSANEILKRIQASSTYVSPAEVAVLQAALGQTEQAFVALDRAYETHDLQLQYLGADPAFDSLREDPRFKRLMEHVGLKSVVGR
jgi:eukaryotic-like serine/threonine-protein kinase